MSSNNIIDFKQAQIFLRDGFTGAAQVNNASGYTTTSTTMVIDNASPAILADGMTFKVGSDTTIYQIISHIETSSHTTSITFAPGLVVAATDNEAITLQPNQLEVRVGEGNVTYEEKRPRVYRKNRGRLDTVKDDDEAPIDVVLDAVWDHLIGVTNDPPTVEEALKQDGNASTWVSSDPDVCQPYALDIVILYTPLCTTSEPEQIVLQKFRYESIPHDLKAGTLNIKGSCNVTRANRSRISA